MDKIATVNNKVKCAEWITMVEDCRNSGLPVRVCKFRFDGTPVPLTAAWPFRSERHEFPLQAARSDAIE